jgi:glycosyltransferase involved in cell wall biosynthesis
VSVGLGRVPAHRERRILWFTDTLCDLNGVSYSLVEIGRTAHELGKPLELVTSLHPEDDTGRLPPNVMNLPLVASFPLPEYENLRIRVPSLLATLRLVQEFDPDVIYLSSPAMIGLVGLFVGKLMRVPCVGVYHTDFTLQAAKVIDDSRVTHYLDEYLRWFYGMCDEVLSNTPGYMKILEERGYDVDRMSVIDRGIDTDRFRPVSGAFDLARKKWGLRRRGFVLYVGRISKDKSVELLIRAYLASQLDHTDLVIAGDGPDLRELEKRYHPEHRIRFLGRVDHEDLPLLYSAAHCFAFPSTTDTFGRVVLEAQACGAPVLVSSVGGPCEVMRDGETGYIVEAQTVEAWSSALDRIIREILLETNSSDSGSQTQGFADRSRALVVDHYSLTRFVEHLFSAGGSSGA